MESPEPEPCAWFYCAACAEAHEVTSWEMAFHLLEQHGETKVVINKPKLEFEKMMRAQGFDECSTT